MYTRNFVIANKLHIRVHIKYLYVINYTQGTQADNKYYFTMQIIIYTDTHEILLTHTCTHKMFVCFAGIQGTHKVCVLYK